MNPPVNLLLVDDRAENLCALKAVLNRPEYRLTEARSGQEALQALLTNEFALIILDVSMPQMDGFELARLIKGRLKTRDVPIIFLTAFLSDDQQVLTGYYAGAVDYVSKPINPQVLESKVSVFIELHHKTRALRETIGLLEREIAERKQREQELKRLEWLLRPRTRNAEPRPQTYEPIYGDLLKLNRCRLILDSVGPETLTDIVRDYLDLLETSAAVYEKNGDYALGIFSSGWCRFMDARSRALCGTEENTLALACGRWHCHESCWTKASKVSIETEQPVDIECEGGLHLYAVPIRAHGEIIGSINFGYGDPPRDKEKLAELAKKYQVSADELRPHAEAYESRPPYIIELAKDRLQASARLIGEIVERKQAEDKVRELNADLEYRVRARTVELELANKELEAFSYSVSHDLRAPLRAIDGFSKILLLQHKHELSGEAQSFLDMIRANTQQMGQLIDELLQFSRLNRQALKLQSVSPNQLVHDCIELLRPETEGRQVQVTVDELPPCVADPRLLKLVWQNLLSNAFKYTRLSQPAHIHIGCQQEPVLTYFVRDNGVGFNMKYAGKLFGVFQRLHRAEDYEGTGVGLATAQRIVQRHGGRIWGEAAPNKGATFYFTLQPLPPSPLVPSCAETTIPVPIPIALSQGSPADLSIVPLAKSGTSAKEAQDNRSMNPDPPESAAPQRAEGISL